MIFNDSVLKKLMKGAYKGAGLLVANKDGRIVLAGSWWVITMDERVFTKKAKAALVELTGQLPAQGECWRTTSAGNQIEMFPVYAEIDGAIREEVMEVEPFKKTIVTIDGFAWGMARLYQRAGQVICINEIVETLLDFSGAGEEEDIDICGPFTKDVESPEGFYWYTDECSFSANRVAFEQDEYGVFLKSLEENIRLPEARR